jgi:hypothetical protein
MCSQKVAIVHKGKCGTCAPNQLPGGFPFCAAGDRTGVSPVCGKNGVTYRNSIAAGAASVEVASTGTCPGSQCGQEVRLPCWLVRMLGSKDHTVAGAEVGTTHWTASLPPNKFYSQDEKINECIYRPEF